MRLETIWQDVKYGSRMLWNSPAFTAVAVLSLALGIGANTAIFSVMDAVLLKMLPVSRPEELVRTNSNISYPAYLKLRARSQTLSGLCAVSFFQTNIRISAEAEHGPPAQMVCGDYYSLLGVNAVVGRLLTPEDDQIPGVGGPQGPAAVISYPYWERRFGLDPAVVGKIINVNGVAVTIVGVTPQRFFGLFQTFSPDVTVPITLQPRVAPSPSTELWLNGHTGSFLDYDDTDDYSPFYIGRMKPGVTVAATKAELTVLFQQIVSARAGSQLDEKKRHEIQEKKVELVPVGNGSGFLEPKTKALVLIAVMTAPFLVLLIACANVANLLLARAASRQKEVALRMAVGAGRFRLIRQLVTESVLLAVIGGALGVALATGGRKLLIAWVAAAVDGPVSIHAETDPRVLLFTLAISLGAAIVFGLAPAFRATRTDLAPLLKEGGRGSTVGKRRLEAGKLLVAGQIAVSLLLLVGAGLFIRTLQNFRSFDPGFDQEKLIVVNTQLLGYGGPQTGNLLKEIWDRTASLPGTKAVGLTMDLVPFGDRRLKISVQGYTPHKSEDEMYVGRMLVGPGFFDAMGIPLLAGRGITARDDEKMPKVCVVSAAMANTYFPNTSPLGRHFMLLRQGADYDIEIVGVAKDIKRAEKTDTIWRAIYCPMLQDLPVGTVNLLVRTAGNPAPVIAAVRHEFQGLDKNLYLDVKTMEGLVNLNHFGERFIATLASVFGALALLLASVGLYGVMAYSVSRRTNEIGIRMALGAQRGDVTRMVLRETFWMLAIGLVVGLLAAAGAARLVAGILFGVSPNDPLTNVLAAVTLAVVGLIAGYLPARRAAQIDPMAALRHE